MGQPAAPAPSPTGAPSTPVDQTTLNANRTEILVLAIGILFLVSQLVLVIWLLARPRPHARPREADQRAITWAALNTKPTITLNDDDHDADDGDHHVRESRQHGVRRSSTWNGRSVIATGDDGHHLLLRRRRRRKSSGNGLELADLRSPLSSPETDSDWDSSDHHGGRVGKGCRDVGLVAAALAMPIVPLSPRRVRSPPPGRSTPQNGPSSKSDGLAREMASLPAGLSPRSPRVVPVDQATMSAILNGERDQEAEVGTPPVSPAVEGGRELASEFEDPLGVNRRVTGFRDENDASLDGERPRGRKRADTR